MFCSSLISHFLLLFVFLHVCVRVCCRLLQYARVSFTTVHPVNGIYYHSIKSLKRTLPKNAPLRKAFGCVAWQQCSCCASCLSILPSPLSSSRSRGNMSPDTAFDETKTKRLSVLQAVAQGYYPISQQDREEDMCIGKVWLRRYTTSLGIQ